MYDKKDMLSYVLDIVYKIYLRYNKLDMFRNNGHKKVDKQEEYYHERKSLQLRLRR